MLNRQKIVKLDGNFDDAKVGFVSGIGLTSQTSEADLVLTPFILKDLTTETAVDSINSIEEI